MGFDYKCDFDLKDCLEALGIEDKGRVQRIVDEAFMLGVEPYVPLDTGLLKDSAALHTVVGSGVVEWEAENKARRLYYGEKNWNWSNGGIQDDGLRGHYWADRYLQNGGKEAIEKAAKSEVGK